MLGLCWWWRIGGLSEGGCGTNALGLTFSSARWTAAAATSAPALTTLLQAKKSSHNFRESTAAVVDAASTGNHENLERKTRWKQQR